LNKIGGFVLKKMSGLTQNQLKNILQPVEDSIKTMEVQQNEVPKIDLLELFPPNEGEINQIYGRIGQGKTALATLMVLQDLAKGRVVYCNWKLKFEGIDERKQRSSLLIGIFGLKSRYYRFPKENLRYIDIDEHFLDNFEKLTDCVVYLDEGHVAFDSYVMAKMSLRKRKTVLHTRHFDRTIIIISQRPQAIHTTLRGNVNRFYKCEKLLSFPFLLFRRSEIQDVDGMNNLPDETKIVHKKLFIGWKSLLNMYDSKYMRQGIEPSQYVHFNAYDLSYGLKWQFFKKNWRNKYGIDKTDA